VKRFTKLLLISGFVVCMQGCSHSVIAPPAARPADSVGGTTQAAIESMREALGEGKAELSTDPTSSAKQFYFLFNVSVPQNNVIQSYTILVARNQDRVALLVQDMRGRCIAYATDRLLVALDPSRPGGLLCALGGYPAFCLTILKNDATHLKVGYGSIPSSTVMLPLGDWLRESMASLKTASFDSASGVYTLAWPRLVMQVRFFPINSPGPIKVQWIGVKNEENVDLGFQVGSGPRPSLGSVELFRDPLLTADRVTHVGLPVRVVEASELSSPGFLSTFAVPAKFGQDPDELLASERLGAAISSFRLSRTFK